MDSKLVEQGVWSISDADSSVLRIVAAADLEGPQTLLIDGRKYLIEPVPTSKASARRFLSRTGQQGQ
jgi:hypothetical protein